MTREMNILFRVVGRLKKCTFALFTIIGKSRDFPLIIKISEKMEKMIEIGKQARGAANILQYVKSEEKSAALLKIIKVLTEKKSEIFEANELDKEVRKYD